MKWKENEDITYEYIKNISDKINANELLVKIILNRRQDENFIRLVLKDTFEAIIEPELLVNGKEVAERIKHHIDSGSSIIIDADYDSDGLNSGSIIYNVISDIIDYTNSNATVSVHYPERCEGYGLSFELAELFVQTSQIIDNDILVITVDNGISQVEQINYLIENDIEVVVIDHHESKPITPNCLICDPHNHNVEQSDIYNHLCGAGVTFKVCELLQKLYDFHDMSKYVVNLAIATITDMMPLTIENIAFIKYGLSIINSDECPENIKYMKEYLGITTMNAMHIGWEIGPRLNACGRMGNTKLAGDFINCNNYDEIVDMVNAIELLNDERKEHTKLAKEELKKLNFDDSYFCVIEVENIPEGIIGILAGAAVEYFNKPSIVVVNHNGIMSGSARSIPGMNLQYLFDTEIRKGNLLNFGGHSEAAGVSFYADKFEELQESLNNSIKNILYELLKNNKDTLLANTEIEEPYLLIDECINIEHLNKDTFELINELIYDNTYFKKPIFAILDCEVIDYIPTMNNPNNLWLTIKQENETAKLWCKDMTTLYEELGCPKYIHVAGHIEKNFMANGRQYILKIIDIKKAE